MPFRMFYDVCPEVAARETRSITLLDGPGAHAELPPGPYFFHEMFCDEPNCDCRRAFFLVGTSPTKPPLATIAWGWESLEFYTRWLGKAANVMDATMLRGPVLNLGSPVTRWSDHLLELAKDYLLSDAAYVERVVRHYHLFRQQLAQRQRRNAIPTRPAGSKTRETHTKRKKPRTGSAGWKSR